jgi:hypothetical protein
MKRTIFACLLVLWFQPTASADNGWGIQIVDASAKLQGRTCIAVDAAGNPHISYYDSTYKDLKYAYWNGSAWTAETIDSAGDVGLYNSLALDSGGNPRISYYDSTNGDLKYAYWNGSEWITQTVDSVGKVGECPSLALDSDGNPHMSYHDLTAYDLKYAYWNGSSWAIQTVDSAGYVGNDSSLRLDSGDNPRISYYGNSGLKYAFWGGSSWTIQSVGDTGDTYFSSLALDPSGHPQISYFNGEGVDELRYASWNGSSWTIRAVDTGNVGYYSSLVLDSCGSPHISYEDGNNGDLKYTYWNGLSWTRQTVDSAGRVGYGGSLALDLNGNRHISYYGEGNGLKYAFGSASLLFPPQVVDDGASTPDASRLHASWVGYPPFAPVEYEYAVGESLSSLIISWKSAGNQTSATETGLALEGARTYYWFVRARNEQGLWSNVGSSDGITILIPCSIGSAKTAFVGKPVYLADAVVASPNVDHPGLWISSADRQSGTAVDGTLPVTRGQKIDVAGVLSWQDGVPHLTQVELKNTYDPVPLRAPFFTTTTLANDLNECLNYTGINPVGLLATIYGKVHRVDTANLVFYVNDGGNLTDGMGPSYDPFVGLRVSYKSTIAPPAAGKKVRVTGIRTVEKVTLQYGAFVNGEYHFPGETLYLPVLKVRDANDIIKY